MPIQYIAGGYTNPPLPMLDPRTNPTSLRHQIMVTVNKMDEWIACADATR